MKKFDQTRIDYVYEKLKSIYADFSGEEVAEALKKYRAEVQQAEDQARIKAQIAELESRLE
jgi:Mor family transcriptional regulator